ncbi:Zinc finger protein 385B [Galemys pyrenaicus]|uniref:Zinc finger protein 385B n=1 Tax=Galemys pyrenaicus TaxID=202257 RepID=A0A8J6A782_GALPY|nr:Zinc finger protein 385B [Galemys pyrenaicus]
MELEREGANGAAAAAGMEVRLGEIQARSPTALQLPFSEGAAPAARKDHVSVMAPDHAAPLPARAHRRSAPRGAAPGTCSARAAQGRVPETLLGTRGRDSAGARLREPGIQITAGGRRGLEAAPCSGGERWSGMKRPLSPSPLAEKEPPTSGAAECPPRSSEPPKPKREKKRPSYTICDVCNIQLNSAAQAQVHCGGRAHQRRLRQLSLGKSPAGPGQCDRVLLLQTWNGLP